MKSLKAEEVISTLNLAPHPEGGWYRETYRAPSPDGTRGAATSILFLLKEGEASHWHRVDASEIWIHQGGGALELQIAQNGLVEAFRLGPDLIGGDLLQKVVPPQAWQAARALGDYALVACVVAPAFSFDGFELAPPGWSPGIDA